MDLLDVCLSCSFLKLSISKNVFFASAQLIQSDTNKVQDISIINFLPNEAKYTLSYKFLFFYFSSSHVKMDVCSGDDLQKFFPSEADG